MYKNESFYVQTLKRVKEELKRIEEEENILITFKKWALHPCSQGDWQIQYQNFPPSHPTEIKNCRKFKSVKFNSKGVIGEFWHVPRTLLTKDYQSLENKDYKNGKLKRTVSRDFLLLFFAWFSPHLDSLFIH